jgi:V/A-type H+/Na+-transporting ATPase subunit E
MANLSALLEKEASAEIEALLSEAQHRASEIVANTEAEADEHKARQERLAQSQAEAILVRARSAAQLEAASLQLKAKHEAVEQVFSEARASFEALRKTKKNYLPVLEGLLSEAVESLGGSDNVAAVIVNSKDKAIAEEAAENHGLKAVLETSDDIDLGVRVRAKTGNITLENTLPERLEMLRDELASEVSALLFKDEA